MRIDALGTRIEVLLGAADVEELAPPLHFLARVLGEVGVVDGDDVGLVDVLLQKLNDILVKVAIEFVFFDENVAVLGPRGGMLLGVNVLLGVRGVPVELLRSHGGDVVKWIANDVEKLDAVATVADELELLENLVSLPALHEQRNGGALLVANHAQAGELALPHGRHRVVVPYNAVLRMHTLAGVVGEAGPLEERVSDDGAKESVDRGAVEEFFANQNVAFVRNDHVGVRVEQRADERMARTRIADEKHKCFHLIK